MAFKVTGAGLRNLPTRAIVYMLTASFLIIILDTAVKWLAKGYSPLQIGFVRYVIGLGVAMAIATRAGGLGTLRTRRIGGHLLRSALNLTTMLSFYYALRLLPLADSIAINFAAPLFVTALSGPMLGEHVGIRRWIAVGFGFAGVLLAVQPSPSGISLGAGLALLSGLCWALTIVTSRQISGTESSHTILFYYSLAVVVVLGATMPTLVDPTLLPRLDLVHRRRPLRQLRPVLLQPGLPLWRGLHGRPVGLSQHRLGDADGLRRLRRHSELAGPGRGGLHHRQQHLYRAARGHAGPRAPQRDRMSRLAKAGHIRRSFPLRGLVYMGLGVFCMSVVDAASKQLVGGYSLAQIMFFTRIPAPFFAIALAMAQGGLLTLARAGWAGMCSAASPAPRRR